MPAAFEAFQMPQSMVSVTKLGMFQSFMMACTFLITPARLGEPYQCQASAVTATREDGGGEEASHHESPCGPKKGRCMSPHRVTEGWASVYFPLPLHLAS